MNKKYNSMCVMRAAHKKPHKGTTKIANTQVFVRFFAYRILFYHYRTTYLLFCKKKCTFALDFILE